MRKECIEEVLVVRIRIHIYLPQEQSEENQRPVRRSHIEQAIVQATRIPMLCDQDFDPLMIRRRFWSGGRHVICPVLPVALQVLQKSQKRRLENVSAEKTAWMDYGECLRSN